MSTASEHMECPQCGGAMEVDAEGLMLVCPYCGNHEPLDETTARRLNAEAYKETAQAENEKMQARLAMAQQFSKGVGKTKHTVKRVIIIIVAAFILLMIASCAIEIIDEILWDAEQSSQLNTEYTWPSSGLAQKIPQPTQTKGHISDYGGDYFEIEVICPDESDWEDYINRARAAGFTVDEQSKGHDFTAYNSEGYQIDVYYYTYDDPNTMDITIEAPIQAHTLTWPTSGVGALLPAPASLLGELENNSSSSFRAIITNTTPEAFTAYANDCIAAGFNRDYYFRERSFSGYDSSNHYLSLTYLGYNQMEINLSTRSSGK